MGLRRALRAWALACVLAALVVFSLLMVLRPLDPSVGRPLALGVQSTTVLVAGAVMAVQARRARGGLRRARFLLSGSLFCATLGGVLALVLPVIGGGPAPVPSLADAVHFAYLPLCVAGVLSYPVLQDEEGSSARTLLDGVVAAAGLWFVTYVLLLGPVGVGADLPVLAALTILGYPAADVFVIAMAAGALHRVVPEARRELGFAAAGVSLYAVSDIGYAVLATQGRYTADSWIAAAAEAGLVLLLLGVVQDSPSQARPPLQVRWVGVLPYGSVVVALGLAAWLAGTGSGMRPGELGLLCVVMAALLLRQVAGTRDRNALTQRLRKSKALFRSLVTGSSDLITLHDLSGAILYASPAVSRLTGLEHDELGRAPLRVIIHPDDLPAVVQAGRDFRSTAGGQTELLVRVRSADGGWRWCRTVVNDLRSDPDVRGIVCNTRDVHERHLLEQQVHHAAHHDALTGLGNLAHARRLMEAACADGATPTTVALIDLDGFKQVNDTYGHGQGDALLIAVADRLRRCVREHDAVARIGGDEFLIVLSGEPDPEALGERILLALREPIAVQGRPLSIGASVGLASTAQGRHSPDDLLRNADLAMYSAKTAGRNRFCWYEPRLHQTAVRHLEISRGLRTALAEDQFALEYQPIVRLPHGEVVGVEALIRWQPPDGGLVPPDVFIPIAEESGIMLDIDAWVLERACRDLARWQAAGRHVPQVSVNISRLHLTADLPMLVEGALRRHGLRGADLCLEITETAVASDAGTAVAVLTALRESGVHIALDDFGTGQSSLWQLRQLPLDKVKIDKSFLPTSVHDSTALRVLTSVVGLCQALSLPVTVEGIEESSLADHLADIGCTYGQGFHFGRPQSIDAITPVLPRRQHEPLAAQARRATVRSVDAPSEPSTPLVRTVDASQNLTYAACTD